MTGTGEDRQRLLLIAPQPFFRLTGTPINVRLMCQALTESGFEVHLLTLPHGEDLSLPHLVIHRVSRLPFVTSVPVGFSLAKAAYNLRLAAATWRLLRRQHFAALHALEEAAFYAIPLGRWRGIPAVIDLDSDLCQQLQDHASILVRLLAGPARMLRRFALRRASCVISVAPRLSELARREEAGGPVFQITDIPTASAARPADPATIERYRKRLGLERARLVVYTGNLDRRQGLPELIEAMPQVLHAHPDAVLLVVGGQPAEIASLQNRVDRLGFGGAVRLIGQQPLDTMAEYMGMADVLVSPRLEPHVTPLKIFNYMASGRPIVATDLPTHSDVLDAGTAILVPPTAAGLARGIIRALDDPDAAAQLGKRAQNLVRKRYSFVSFRRQLLEAYAAIGVTPTRPSCTFTLVS